MNLEIEFENLNLEIDILEMRLTERRDQLADRSVLGIKEASALKECNSEVVWSVLQRKW